MRIMNQFVCVVITSLSVLIAEAGEITLTASQQKSMGIAVAQVERAVAGQAKRFSAEVILPPAQERLISAPQSGLLESMLVAVGDTVKKGQVLARISSPDLALLQRDYLQANIQKRLADQSASRDEALFKEGIIPERRYIETKSQQEAANAQLSQTKQSLRLAGVGDAAIANMSHTKGMQTSIALVAPIGGVVLEQLASVGQRIDSAMPVYRLAQLDKLWIELSVPLEYIPQVQLGSTVTVPNKQVIGKVVAILRSVNKQNQTTKVRVDITQGTSAVSPGELLQADVQTNDALQSDTETLKVPQSALVRNGQQVTVFKQVAKGFAAVNVSLLSEQGAFALIQGNLKPKDRVAVKGIIALKGAALGMGAE
jgi:cobalt-zinc-cadmium efflux system membrane fusion protein